MWANYLQNTEFLSNTPNLVWILIQEQPWLCNVGVGEELVQGGCGVGYGGRAAKWEFHFLIGGVGGDLLAYFFQRVQVHITKGPRDYADSILSDLFINLNG